MYNLIRCVNAALCMPIVEKGFIPAISHEKKQTRQGSILPTLLNLISLAGGNKSRQITASASILMCSKVRTKTFQPDKEKGN